MSALDRILGGLMRGAAVACFAALFALLLANVVARSFQLAGFAWFDEIVQALFAWMVFVGAAALWREKGHFQVLWLPEALPERPARAARILIVLLGLCFLAAMTWYGATLTFKARALTPILALPTAWLYAAIPVSGALMCAYSLADLFLLLTRKDPR